METFRNKVQLFNICNDTNYNSIEELLRGSISMYSISDLSREMNICYQTLYNRAKVLGLDYRKFVNNYNETLTASQNLGYPDINSCVISLYVEKEYTAKKIGQMIGVSTQKVLSVLKSNYIDRRPRGGAYNKRRLK